VVIDNEYGPVIRAQSSSGAGGIVRKMSEDPQELPFIKWSWKVEDVLSDSSVSRKDGDDFAARLMISFKRRGPESENIDDNILCYVWASEEPVNTFAPNPHLKNVMTVVAAGAEEQTGRWLEISRNVVEDYRQAFSEDPGLITGVALMTDCDNTESSALAWYGPIWLSGEADGSN